MSDVQKNLSDEAVDALNKVMTTAAAGSNCHTLEEVEAYLDHLEMVIGIVRYCVVENEDENEDEDEDEDNEMYLNARH